MEIKTGWGGTAECCDWCFITFGTAEPRKYVGPVWDEKKYHFSCFRIKELKEMILKDIKRNEKVSRHHKTI